MHFSPTGSRLTKQHLFFLLTCKPLSTCMNVLAQGMGTYRMRRQFFLLDDGAPYVKPVVISIFLQNHYFIAIFLYSSQEIYMLGNRINEAGLTKAEDAKWEQRHGPILWERIALLCGWDPCPKEMVKRFRINWLQVMDNCTGVAVCSTHTITTLHSKNASKSITRCLQVP